MLLLLLRLRLLLRWLAARHRLERRRRLQRLWLLPQAAACHMVWPGAAAGALCAQEGAWQGRDWAAAKQPMSAGHRPVAGSSCPAAGNQL